MYDLVSEIRSNLQNVIPVTVIHTVICDTDFDKSVKFTSFAYAPAAYTYSLLTTPPKI